MNQWGQVYQKNWIIFNVLVNLEELRELIINDGKGGFSTFCDQGTVGIV